MKISATVWTHVAREKTSHSCCEYSIFMSFVSRLILSPAVLSNLQMHLVSQSMLILQQRTHTALWRSLHTALAGLRRVTPRPSMS